MYEMNPQFFQWYKSQFGNVLKGGLTRNERFQQKKTFVNKLLSATNEPKSSNEEELTPEQEVETEAKLTAAKQNLLEKATAFMPTPTINNNDNDDEEELENGMRQSVNKRMQPKRPQPRKAKQPSEHELKKEKQLSLLYRQALERRYAAQDKNLQTITRMLAADPLLLEYAQQNTNAMRGMSSKQALKFVRGLRRQLKSMQQQAQQAQLNNQNNLNNDPRNLQLDNASNNLLFVAWLSSQAQNNLDAANQQQQDNLEDAVNIQANNQATDETEYEDQQQDNLKTLTDDEKAERMAAALEVSQQISSPPTPKPRSKAEKAGELAWVHKEVHKEVRKAEHTIGKELEKKFEKEITHEFGTGLTRLS